MKLIGKDIHLRLWIMITPEHSIEVIGYSTLDFYFYTQLSLTKTLDHSRYNLLKGL